MNWQEVLTHRQTLEEEGWLEGGTILHYWTIESNNYPISYYVVAFAKTGNKHSLDAVDIQCIRVFGGDKSDVLISIDQDVTVCPRGHSKFNFGKKPNWDPAEGYER